MATWAMKQRYAWIDARLAEGGSFNRDDIVQAFTVTKQTASATVAEYRALHPDTLRYDGSRKAFVRADAAALKPSSQWLLSLLYETLRRNRAALDLIDPIRPLQYATTMDLMRKDMDAAIAQAEAVS